MAKSKCPICDAEVAPRATNELFPFCSARCKTIDLGKWLSEDYRVAGESADSAEVDEDAGPKGDMRH
jgi:endogenous inhibitor of DNA gyrase (YacG/DUF329 family)